MKWLKGINKWTSSFLEINKWRLEKVLRSVSSVNKNMRKQRLIDSETEEFIIRVNNSDNESDFWDCTDDQDDSLDGIEPLP